MSDTTKQLMQLIHDMGVISERMDAKNRRIEQLEAKVKELTGLLREHLYAPDNQKIREWEDLAKRSRAALSQGVSDV
jgi:DNA repair ATPase RecN